MQFKTSLLVAFCASLFLPACSSPSNNAPQVASAAKVQGVHTQSDVSIYQQRGMEISSITSRMADTLQQNLFYYLLPDAPIDRSAANGNVKIVTMPRIAITSFVDTDTYENSGYLGRALAELFTHDLSERAFEVTEYKLTGRISVTNDGDFILSRNWKKIAKDTKVKYLLGGTLTRNKDGIVVIARLINMQSRQVIASSTGFIPYALLPYCYRTGEKKCAFTGVKDYLAPDEIRNAGYYKQKYFETQARLNEYLRSSKASVEEKEALTKARVVSASGKPVGGVFLSPSQAPVNSGVAPAAQPSSISTAPAQAPAQAPSAQAVPTYYQNSVQQTQQKIAADPRFRDQVVVGATSRGNYDRYVEQRDGSSGFTSCTFGSCLDPVIYPSNTYMHNTLLIRDVADESSYGRVAQ